jgi:hypothetical protein
LGNRGEKTWQHDENQGFVSPLSFSRILIDKALAFSGFFPA